jgi:hypothetical protein
VSLGTILSDILQIEYTDASGLSVLDGVAEEITATGHKAWNLIHYYRVGGVETVTAYTRLDGDYEGFSNLMIAAGDVVQLVYMDDGDGDEVGARTEAIFGSDPADPDSDDDGLEDGDEVFGVTIENLCFDERALYPSPAVPDSDGDGVDDATEVAAGDDPVSRFPVRINLGDNTTDRWSDRINDLVPTVDGGVLVAGLSDHHSTVPEPGKFLWHSAWEIAKLNADGTEDAAWRHTISTSLNGDNENSANALALGENGSVYVVGVRTGICNMASEDNWYVTKYTSPGTEATSGWQKSIDFDGDNVTVCLSDRANAVAVDSAGNVYVGGYATTNETYGDKNWTIKKFSPNGTEITTGWNKRDDVAQSDEEVLELAVDDANNLYAVGYVVNQAGASSGRDIRIVKYNAAGTELDNAVLEFDTDGTDSVTAIAVSNGRLFVAGSASTFRWALKAVMLDTLDEDATWYKWGQFQQHALVGAMTVDASARVYLAIDSQQAGGYAQRWYLKRYDAAGVEDADWNLYVSELSQSNHVARAMALHPSGALYLGGYLDVPDPQFATEWYLRKYYVTP